MAGLLDDPEQPALAGGDPPEEDNPYLRRLIAEDQLRAGRLRKTVSDAAATSPARAAEVNRLAHETGQPAAVVERNFDAFQQRAQADAIPAAEILRQSPTLATWASEPHNAAVVQAELPQLGALEFLLTEPSKAFARGINRVQYGKLRYTSMFRDLTREEQDQLQSYKFNSELRGREQTEWWRGAVAGFAEQLPNTLEATLFGLRYGIPAAVTAGTAGALMGPAAPIGVPALFTAGLEAGTAAGAWQFTAEQETAGAYDEYLETRDEFGQPMDPQVARAAAFAVGAINGGLELYGLAAIAKTFAPVVGSLGRAGVRQAVKEALRVPTVRAALVDAMTSYGSALGKNLAEEVLQRAVTILGGEITKAAEARGVVPGQLEQGNINLFTQPRVANPPDAEHPEGSESTVDSISVGVDGQEVLLSRVTPDGRHLTSAEAIAEYQKTGQHLGKFATPEAADAFAQQLHADYAAGKYDVGPGDLGVLPSRFKTAGAIAGDLGQEFLGALQGLALMPAGGVGLSFVHNITRANHAAANVAFFQALGAGVKDLALLKQSPENLEAFIAATTKDGTTETAYIDPGVWATYWQDKGVDPAALAAEVTGDAEAYTTAVDQGQHLAIPIARYAVTLAGTPHHSFFTNELHLDDPNAMNGRESQAFKKEAIAFVERQAAARETAGAAEATGAWTLPNAIHAQVLTQAAAANIPPGQARYLANFYAAAFGHIGDLADEEFFARYGLRVGQEPAPGTRARTAARVAPPSPQTPAQATIAGLGEAAAVAPAVAAEAQPAVAEGDRSAAGSIGDTVPPVSSPVPSPAGEATVPSAAAANLAAQAEAAAARGTPFTAAEMAAGRALQRRAAGVEWEADHAAQAETPVAPTPDTGAGPGDLAPEQPDVDRGGAAEGAGDGERADVRGLPTPGSLGDAFERRPAADTAARLTPAVTRELERIASELETFPYIDVTWDWLPSGQRATGNAAGGQANRIPAQGGAIVYHDILFFAPLNRVTSGERKGELAADTHGARGKVEAAVHRLLTTREAATNLAEGALRVAEHRAAGHWHDRTGASYDATVLPPHWGTEASAALVEQLAADIDAATADPAAPVDLLGGDVDDAAIAEAELLEDPDTSFDVDEFYQSLFDAPVAEFLPASHAAIAQARAAAVQRGEAVFAWRDDTGADVVQIIQPIARPFVRVDPDGTVTPRPPIAPGAPAAAVAEKPRLRLQVGSPLTLNGKAYVIAPQGEKGSAIRRGTVWLVDAARAGHEPLAGEILTLDLKELGALYASGALTVPEAPAVEAPLLEGVEAAGGDVLETGEVQRRFPGDTGAVREQEVATPTMEAPYALTAEIAKPRPGGKQTTLFQPAYHGSRHQFEKFSLHAIGSGEGVQAYGWGLYFASAREVAESYRDAGRGGAARGYDRVTYQGQSYPSGTMIGNLLFDIATDGAAATIARLEASERFNRANDYAPDQAALNRSMIERAHAIDLAGIAIEGRGRVYTVEIPDNEDLLDYDKPASQQSPKVQAALEALGIEWEPLRVPTPAQAMRTFESARIQALARSDIGIREALQEGLHYATTGNVSAFTSWFGKHQGLMRDGVTDPTGQQIYEKLQSRALTSERATITQPSGRQVYENVSLSQAAERASRKLAAVGVPGLRYLDGNSRAAGEGSSNYVIWDDALVQITEFEQGPVGPEPLSDVSVQAWAAEVQQRVGPDLLDFAVRLTPQGDLSLETLAVRRGASNQGLGSKVLHELTRLADLNGTRIVLSLGQRGYQPSEGAAVTSSRARLATFYKRFGFVENRGRYKNYALSLYTSMYREPTLPTPTTFYQEAAPAQTTTPAFRRWFGDSQVVDAQGQPLRVYHGTTASFDTFARAKGNVESDFGAGFYFSNNPRDVAANYAGVGPDLAQKIERRAEQLAQENEADAGDYEDENQREAAAHAAARAEFVEHAGVTVPVYLSLQHPAILGGPNETRLEMVDPRDEEGEPTGEEPTGTLYDFVQALRNEASRYDDGDVEPAIEKIMGASDFESITLADALELLKKDEHFSYFTDDTGTLVGHEIIRAALERAGFDGIIDRTVDVKFGSQRRLGQRMAGMDRRTVHYVAFRPAQIKSAIANRGTFDASGNILHQSAPVPIGEELQQEIPIPATVAVVDLPPAPPAARGASERRRTIVAGVQSSMQRQPVTNAHTGWRVGVTLTGLKKSAKFLWRPEQAAALRQLPRLLEAGTYLRSEADRDDPHGAPYDYLYAPFRFERDWYVAKMALRKGQEGTDRTFYALHAQKITAPARLSTEYISAAATASPEGATPPLGGGAATLSQADLLDFVNQARQTTARFQPGPAAAAPPAAPRGALRFGPDRQMNIALFPTADPSTFLHETGHFFLEVFGDLVDHLQAKDPATLTDPQRRVITDYQTLLAGTFGVTTRAEIQTVHHEQFARLFEAYLRTGQAPSLALRRTFHAFRRWLTKIYASLKQLNVTLTPEVTGILDRLVASDEQIAAAEAQRGAPALFTTAADAGMTDAQFSLYTETMRDAHRTATEQLDVRLFAEERRQQSAAWRAARAPIEAAVSAEVYARPVYRALSAIRSGTLPDGTPLVEGLETPPLTLSQAIIRARHGEARLATLPRGTTVAAGGLDPETVAGLVGYSSGDELLTALAEAPPMRAVITQETQRRMLAEHGDLLTEPEAFAGAAQAAVNNEDREIVVRAELKALGQLRRTAAPFVAQERATAAAALAGERRERAYERRWFEAEAKLKLAQQRGADQATIDALTAEVQNLRQKARGGAATIRAAIPPASVLRETARTQIAQTVIRLLKPGVYWAAARQAADQAVARAARQDFEGAIVAKQQELINIALYREAERVQTEVARRTRRAQDLTRPKTRAAIGQAGGHYLDQIDGVLDRFEFATVSQTVLDRRSALRDFAEGLEAQGLPVDLPPILLAEARRTNYRELTVEAFTEVTDGLQQLVHLARLKNRLLKAQDQRDFAAVRDALVASIRTKNQVRARPLEFTKAGRKWRTVEHWFASHKKFAQLAFELDGAEDGGAMWEAFSRPLNAAADAQETRFTAAATAYAALLERFYPGRELLALNTPLYIAAIDGSLSKEARLSVAMNWGNQTSRDRVLSDPVKGWTLDQVRAILDTLDRRDWTYVQAHWDFLQTFWPEIAEKTKRLTGVAPEKVEALPVETTFGTFPGGYHPLVYDRRLSARAGQHALATEAKLLAAGAYLRSTTRRGHLETRAQHVTLPIRYDFSVITRHLEQVLHDLTHHEMLIDTTRLLRDSQVAKAIYDTAGDQVYDTLGRLLQDVATGTAGPQGRPSILDDAASFLRARAEVAGLGLNFWTALQQPLGLFNGMNVVGVRWVAKGLTRWLRDAVSMESTVGWIHSRSPLMKNRGQTATVELRGLRKTLSAPGGWFDTLVRTVTRDRLTQQAILDSYLWHIGAAQRVADVPTWLGAYEKAMAADASDEARAIALADQAVLDSQGGGHLKDLAEAQRGGPVAKLFMTFASYGVTTLNTTARNVAILSHDRTPAGALRFLGDMTLLYVMPSLLVEMLRCGVGRASCDEVPVWLAKVGGQMISGALNGIVLVRELGAAVNIALGLQTGARGYEGPAGARAIQIMYDLAWQVQQRTLDTGLARAALGAGGILFNFPAAQVQRSIDGWMALEEGRTRNPAALLVGAPPKKARAR